MECKENIDRSSFWNKVLGFIMVVCIFIHPAIWIALAYKIKLSLGFILP